MIGPDSNVPRARIGEIVRGMGARIDQLRRDRGLAFWQLPHEAALHQYSACYRETLDRLPGPARVLDWGAGNGHFAVFLLEQGHDVEAFSLEEDPNTAPIVDEYSGRLRWTVDATSPRSLPYPEDDFDAVVSVGVLEHVRETGGDELASLREIRRVLRPGGLFLCFHFPNAYSYIEAAGKIVWRVAGKPYGHRYKYRRGDIERLTREAGLELLASRRYNFVPRTFSLGRLPPSIGNAPLVNAALNALDRTGSVLGKLWCQNHLFVARRPLED